MSGLGGRGGVSNLLLLVPVPLIYLAHFETELLGESLKSLLVPIRVLQELVHQEIVLLVILSLPLASAVEIICRIDRVLRGRDGFLAIDH
jgi:hypothetical protein